MPDSLIKSQTLSVEPVPWPARSAIISYDNMSRLAEADKYTYKGGPNMRAKYSNWYDVLGKYVPGRAAEKLHLLWSYNPDNGITAKNALNAAVVGGCTNGYYGGADTKYGAVTLYGARAPASGNTFPDPSNPYDVVRLLGESSDDNVLQGTQLGVFSWVKRYPQYGLTMHHDEPCMAATSIPIGGSFYPGTDIGCNIHGQYPAVKYSDYLRSRYANDTAYINDRSNPLNYYNEFKEWMVLKAREFYTNYYTPQARRYGMITTGNCYAPMPSDSPETGHCVLDMFDAGIIELPWFYYNSDRTNYRQYRAQAEDFSSAQTLRNSFASMTFQFAGLQGQKKRAAFAIYPLSAWLPPLSAGAGSPPTTSTYTEPYKVRAHQRVSFAWCYSWGFVPIVPSGIYDNLVDTQPTATGYTDYSGYTGVNKPLFYGDPDHYADLFNFVAQHPHLFEEYQAIASVALMVPATGAVAPWYAGGGNQINSLYWVNNYLRPLIEARVPFNILTVGGPIRRIATNSYDYSKYTKVVKMDSDSNFTARYATPPTGSNVTDYSTFFAGDLTQYSPVTVTGETDSTKPVLTNVRVKPDESGVVIHLVNTNSCDYTASAGAGAANSPQTGIKVTLKTAYTPKKKLSSIQVYKPGQTGGTPVRFSVTPSGIDIWPGPVTDWSVVELTFK